MEAGGHVDGSGGGGGRWTVFILLANGCYTSSNATRGRGVEVAVHKLKGDNAGSACEGAHKRNIEDHNA